MWALYTIHPLTQGQRPLCPPCATIKLVRSLLEAQKEAGCSDNSMDALVAVKFWLCSKQSHDGRRGSWSLTHRLLKQGTRIAVIAKWTDNGCPMVAPWKMRIIANIAFRRPRQPLGHYSNVSAFTLPPLSDLLCLYGSFGGPRNAQVSCCSSYTEAGLFGFMRLVGVLIIFSLEGSTKVVALCKGDLR